MCARCDPNSVEDHLKRHADEGDEDVGLRTEMARLAERVKTLENLVGRRCTCRNCVVIG